jgi:hypothetical protein
MKTKSSAKAKSNAVFNHLPKRKGVLQRKCSDCPKKRKLLQRSAMSQSEPAAVPPIVHEVLRSPGQPLDAATRKFMESRFSHDFSQVRVHDDALATESARAVNALAYTVGQDMVFRTGEYAQNTIRRQGLLAHELTHTLQQDMANNNRSQSKIDIGHPSDRAECEADRTAEAVISGKSCTDNFTKSSLHLRRACGPSEIGKRDLCDPTTYPSTFVYGEKYPCRNEDSCYKFMKNCNDFAPGQEDALIEFGKSLAPRTDFYIHGYASMDGPIDFNKNLSCARANRAHYILIKKAGLSSDRIEGEFGHGPTPGPAEDRRSVVIQTRKSTIPGDCIESEDGQKLRKVSTSQMTIVNYSEAQRKIDIPLAIAKLNEFRDWVLSDRERVPCYNSTESLRQTAFALNDHLKFYEIKRCDSRNYDHSKDLSDLNLLDVIKDATDKIVKNGMSQVSSYWMDTEEKCKKMSKYGGRERAEAGADSIYFCCLFFKPTADPNLEPPVVVTHEYFHNCCYMPHLGEIYTTEQALNDAGPMGYLVRQLATGKKLEPW